MCHFISCSALSWATFQSPEQTLTFQQLHDTPTPTALQRSGWGPSACCPEALPCSVAFDDGSEWPLQMVLPRQRTNECYSNPNKNILCLLSNCWDNGEVRQRAQQEEYYTRALRAPIEDFSAHTVSGTICWNSRFQKYYGDAIQK